MNLKELQHEWAEIKYRQPAAAQEKAFAALTKTADAVRGPCRARGAADLVRHHRRELRRARGGLGALSLAKDAKKALEQALEIDPRALDGSAYTSLGSLYYQVPGWPIGFGNDEKARELLLKALEINPEESTRTISSATSCTARRLRRCARGARQGAQGTAAAEPRARRRGPAQGDRGAARRDALKSRYPRAACASFS